MYCKECGKIIDADSKFCSYCGAKQSSDTSTGNQTELYSKDDSNAKNITVTLSLRRSGNVEERKHNNTVKKKAIDEKYDPTYRKETGARIIGITLGIEMGVVTASGINSGDFSEFITMYILYIIFLIISIIWVVRIAKRQNRNKVGWGIFAFVSPFLALIIIGSLRKLRQPTRA